MLQIATISVLIGMVLGQRFKVLVLVPLLLLTLFAAVIAACARLEPGWTIAETAGSVIVGLQVGYVLGLSVRQLMVRVRARRLHGASQPSTLSRGAVHRTL
jgi:hypothetical protein